MGFFAQDRGDNDEDDPKDFGPTSSGETAINRGGPFGSCAHVDDSSFGFGYERRSSERASIGARSTRKCGCESELGASSIKWGRPHQGLHRDRASQWEEVHNVHN